MPKPATNSKKCDLVPLGKYKVRLGDSYSTSQSTPTVLPTGSNLRGSPVGCELVGGLPSGWMGGGDLKAFVLLLLPCRDIFNTKFVVETRQNSHFCKTVRFLRSVARSTKWV